MIKDLSQEVQGPRTGDTERSGGERSEAPRSGGFPVLERATAAPEVLDPEVAARPRRRQFTAEYKLRIVREADACKGPGEIGALLRREGLYSSHLVVWRRQREEAAQAQLKARKRGPKAKLKDPRVKQLERENARLQRQLKRVELLLDIQKNLRGATAPPVRPETPLRVPSAAPERSGRQLTGDLRARKKTWSGGGRGLDIGDAERRSRLGK